MINETYRTHCTIRKCMLFSFLWAKKKKSIRWSWQILVCFVTFFFRWVRERARHKTVSIFRCRALRARPMILEAPPCPIWWNERRFFSSSSLSTFIKSACSIKMIKCYEFPKKPFVYSNFKNCKMTASFRSSLFLWFVSFFMHCFMLFVCHLCLITLYTYDALVCVF